MIRPSIGARFVCTSKIDKKIPTRRVFVFRTSVSSISIMSVMRPSAAATTSLGFEGTARSGSRQKASVKRIKTRKTSDNRGEIQRLASINKRRMAKMLRPSASVCRRMMGGQFLVRKGVGQAYLASPKMEKRRFSLEPQHPALGSFRFPICSGETLQKTTRLLVVSKTFPAIVFEGRSDPIYAASQRRNSGPKTASQSLDRYRRSPKI